MGCLRYRSSGVAGKFFLDEFRTQRIQMIRSSWHASRFHLLVCMYVCMYVYMYVCMCIYMYALIKLWIEMHFKWYACKSYLWYIKVEPLGRVHWAMSSGFQSRKILGIGRREIPMHIKPSLVIHTLSRQSRHLNMHAYIHTYTSYTGSSSLSMGMSISISWLMLDWLG